MCRGKRERGGESEKIARERERESKLTLFTQWTTVFVEPIYNHILAVALFAKTLCLYALSVCVCGCEVCLLYAMRSAKTIIIIIYTRFRPVNVR